MTTRVNRGFRISKMFRTIAWGVVAGLLIGWQWPEFGGANGAGNAGPAIADAPLSGGVVIARALAQAEPELPRVFLDTTYSPPTRGKLIGVSAGDDLQGAFDTAQPGDVIEIQAGATFTGNFILPKKPGTGWIYIR
jgi:hypothetical protein